MSPRKASSIAQQQSDDSEGGGELPDGWAEVGLFDLCQPSQWPNIATKDLESSGYPVYGANGKIGYYSEFNHIEPTILITCRGATCGTINVSEGKCYVNGNAMCLDDLDQRIVLLMYLSNYLEYRGLEDTITGSGQPQITRTNLEVVTIEVHLRESQRVHHKAASTSRPTRSQSGARCTISSTTQISRATSWLKYTTATNSAFARVRCEWLWIGIVRWKDILEIIFVGHVWHDKAIRLRWSASTLVHVVLCQLRSQMMHRLEC
jgi:hypothetical protein